MSHIIEKDWTTASGLRAVCLLIRNSHRCGYVGVPDNHVLYGIDYGQEVEFLNVEDATIGKKSPMLAITASVNAANGVIRKSPDIAFDVHGGLTYSGGSKDYPVDSNLWWFGFDCAHLGDGSLDESRIDYMDGPVRSMEYVIAECEYLARQIVDVCGDDND